MIKFFVSGNYNDEPSIIEYLVDTHSEVLTTFAYPKMLRDRTAALADQLRARGERLEHMIDSGAFTSWSQGKEVDLDKYCDACNRLLDDYSDCMDFVFVALDKIPGQKGREITQEDRDTACIISAKNYDTMLQRVRGVVKPVFHTGDPGWLLEHYAASDYISFGMSQQLSEQERVDWVVKNCGKVEGRKLHGLAATGFKMLRAAPWHSVDSAAWQYCATMGGINWVREDGRLTAIAVSNQSPKQKELDSHFATLPKAHQELIAAKVAEMGLTIDQLSADYVARWKWNIACYREACRMASFAPRTTITKGLFDD